MERRYFRTKEVGTLISVSPGVLNSWVRYIEDKGYVFEKDDLGRRFNENEVDLFHEYRRLTYSKKIKAIEVAKKLLNDFKNLKTNKIEKTLENMESLSNNGTLHLKSIEFVENTDENRIKRKENIVNKAQINYLKDEVNKVTLKNMELEKELNELRHLVNQIISDLVENECDV